MLLAGRPPAFHCKTLRESEGRGGRRRRRIARSRNRWWWAEKIIQNEQMGDKRFGDEGGQECSISRGGPDCTVEVYMPEESEGGSHSVTAGAAAPRVRAAKSSEFGKGKL